MAPWVPTFMNTGVWAVPWAQVKCAAAGLALGGDDFKHNKLAFSRDEHGVPEAEEPVALPHRLLIGGQHMFPSCQSGDQHDEGGFGQVEVGDEGVQAP